MAIATMVWIASGSGAVLGNDSASPRRIAVIGGEPPIISIVAALGGQPRLVSGYPGVGADLIWTRRLLPDLAVRPRLRGDGALPSVEVLLATAPDLVITPDPPVEQMVTQLGFKVLRLRWDEPGFLERSVDLIAKALNSQAAADRYLDDLAETRALISETRRQQMQTPARVLFCRRGALIQPTRHADLWIGEAGGRSVTDFPRSGEAAQFSREDILLWNPEVVLMMTERDAELIRNDLALKELSAVRAGRVYVVPAGLNHWALPGAEYPLALFWLAATLHPDSDLPARLPGRVAEFYRKFFGLSLSPDEVAVLLRGLPE